MTKRMGSQTVKLDQPPVILGAFSSVGKKEGDGPLGEYFDKISNDEFMNQTTWEQAESELLNQTVTGAAANAQISFGKVQYLFAGDLLNQCTSSSFAIKDFGIPFFGLFGACSTFAESLSLAAMTIDGGYADHCIAATSSHFCSAEKQFRFPIEYGGARTPTSQWTVTGSGAAVLGKTGNGPKITHVTTGKIVDMGITDANNMGAAMAPAAADTIYTHFQDTGYDLNRYDMIITGDLAATGMKLVLDLLADKGLHIADMYRDCGNMIFDAKKQSTKAGGSGCGCCASVFCGYFYKKLLKGELKNVLLVATGALMSPTTAGQGLSIPGIAHAVSIEM